MAARIQPVRGTHDILPDENRRFRYITNTFSQIAERYGMGEIQTPVFEFTDVFKRSLGDTTDVVTKEMYTFEDRSGDMLTLRPEYTAGIARAFISGGMMQNAPCKFYGYGPMFRHERPQKGRLRQFHQLDAEILGVAEPQADIELLALAYDLLTEIGLGDQVVLEINTLGDVESRQAYRGVLIDFFEKHKAGLSEDSLKRLEANPLRILDSKDEGDKKIVAQAPDMTASMNEASAHFFAAVRAGLDTLGIPYVINPRLVRGLDYYCHTAFEFTTTALGAQGTVLAGGRYDGLVEQLGGPATPGVGWAAGIERLSMLIRKDMPVTRPAAVIPVGNSAQVQAEKIAHELRRKGLSVEMGYRGNLGKRMKRANKFNARIAIILGDEELARGVAMVRDLDSGDQTEIALDDITAHVIPFF